MPNERTTDDDMTADTNDEDIIGRGEDEDDSEFDEDEADELDEDADDTDDVDQE